MVKEQLLKSERATEFEMLPPNKTRPPECPLSAWRRASNLTVRYHKRAVEKTIGHFELVKQFRISQMLESYIYSQIVLCSVVLHEDSTEPRTISKA